MLRHLWDINSQLGRIESRLEDRISNHCLSKSRHVNIVHSDDVDDSRIVEDVYIHPKSTSVVEDTIVDSSFPILDEIHVSSECSSDVVGALVEFSTPILDDIYDTSKSDALHLSFAQDGIPRQVAVCNDDYKFAVCSHSILQKFAVDNEVMVMIHFERFPLGTMRKSNARHTKSYRVPRRIVFMTLELDIPMRSWYQSGFQWGEFDSCCMCLSRSAIGCNGSITETSFTSTTLVQT